MKSNTSERSIMFFLAFPGKGMNINILVLQISIQFACKSWILPAKQMGICVNRIK